MFEIYIATLKARIAGGPCQHGDGRGREDLVFQCQLPVLENGSLRQGRGKHTSVFSKLGLCLWWMFQGLEI